MIIAGMAMPAISAMPMGAPTSVPNCHRIFFFRLHGFLPQKVQPEGLGRGGKRKGGQMSVITSTPYTNQCLLYKRLSHAHNHFLKSVITTDVVTCLKQVRVCVYLK